MFYKTEKEIISKWNKSVAEKPMVSIRCITYNHAQYIEQTLDSFLMQETEYSYEIVIHDDASQDGTTEIIKEYESKYPSIIKPIYETENQWKKHDDTIRKVINNALRGKYTALCEGDDYWTDPHKLQIQIDFLESNPDYSMVFNAAYYVKDGIILRNDRHTLQECDYNTEDMILGGGEFCATASLCVRTKLFLKRYAFQDIADVGDYPWQIAMSLRGKVHYFPKIMSAYRVSNGNNASWTNIVLKNKEGIRNHIYNEIKWLQVLDIETDRIYSKPVQNRIVSDYLSLYDLNGITKKELREAMFRYREGVLFNKQVIKRYLLITHNKMGAYYLKRIKPLINNK